MLIALRRAFAIVILQFLSPARDASYNAYAMPAYFPRPSQVDWTIKMPGMTTPSCGHAPVPMEPAMNVATDWAAHAGHQPEGLALQHETILSYKA